MNIKLKGTRLLFTLIIIALSLVMIIPFVWMISASFKMQRDVMSIPIKWIPKYFYPDNYLQVLNIKGAGSRNYNMVLAYKNSIKLAVIDVFLSLSAAALAGYAFAKLKFFGSRFLFILFLAQLMVPPQLTLVPRFALFSWLHINNTHWSIILPCIISVTAVFMMRQAFISVPNEMRESAKIDGAGEFRIWWSICIPMVTPTLGALATVQFLDNWNAYLYPLIFLSNWRLHTLPLALNQFVGDTFSQDNLTMAACCLAVIPVFIVFLAGQKFFVKGLTIGSLKG
ncbi:MAG: carbohydrate ABC transporter permease [Treponema sp.]|nr:carbohydrate ABC transporter permease [Treponema sp.]